MGCQLQGSGIHAFSIGPGLVRTPGAAAGIAKLAPLYGTSVEELYAMSRDQIVSPEEAGAGCAAAIALAGQFQGEDIGVRQVLIAAGFEKDPEKQLQQAAVIQAWHEEVERLRRILA